MFQQLVHWRYVASLQNAIHIGLATVTHFTLIEEKTSYNRKYKDFHTVQI